MIRTDITIAVWWRTSAEARRSPALKGQKRAWHRRRRSEKSLNELLQPRRRAYLRRRAVPVRIARQDFLVELLFFHAGRQLSQILVQPGRADHLQNIRLLRSRS